MAGILHEDQYTFLIISCSVRIRNVSDKICREYQNTHFVFVNFFFLENRAVYEIMWKNMIDRGRPQMTIWRMRIACWINKTTNVCDTDCFSTPTVVARTHLNITSYVYSCLAI